MTRQKAWSDVEVSAYLDGALDAPSRQAFEAAITRDDDLQARVDDLRAIVDLVRAVPLREPPRNYLLTPGMVAEAAPKRAPRRRAPLLLMRLATSLTAAAFVVTVGLNFLSRGFGPNLMTMEDAAEFSSQAPVTVETEQIVELAAEVEVAVEEKRVEQTPSSQQEMEFAPLQAPKAPGEGVGGGGTAPEAAPSQAENVTPEMDVQKAGGDGDTAPPEGMRALSATDAVTETTAQAEVVPPGAASAPTVTGELSEEPAANAELTAYADGRAVEPTQTRRGLASLWLPAALGAATLLLAGITLGMSRRR